MLDKAVMEKLKEVAQKIVAPGKGLLAADESIGTAAKRFAPINLENTQENRRAFRDMFLTTKGIGQYISGVILFDETIRQNALNGKGFVDVLITEGVLPGIKVDEGTYDMPDSPTEKLTKGLEGLDVRLKEYKDMGAVFCKWRAVITISETTPTDANLLQNAKDLAQYALLCQENGLVPVVEPEVLIDGNHTREKAKKITGKTLSILFDQCQKMGVAMEGLVLKTSMVIAGKDSHEKETPKDVAKATIDLFEKVIPKNLAGIVFLSGGQSEIQATENLNAMHLGQHLPWPLTFSYSRALEEGAILAWHGKKENVSAAQRVFLHRAKMNSLASMGKYTPEMEQELL